MSLPSDLKRSGDRGWDLARSGDRPALLTTDGEALSYSELARRVDEVRDRLAGPKRLVALTGSNTVETITAYLGALRAGHAVLVAPPGKPTVWAAEADIAVTDGSIDIRRSQPRHALHPDLALLLSTSGSTGSGKLVRLSWRNIESNADAIAQYLQITDADRAVTTLPMHYCYGLSVIHSYLSRGASLLLTDASVADPGFWDLAREHRVTSFAGVPHTFELLDRIGFENLDLPDLRYVTQAGGRMAPERVRAFAALGRSRGWRLFVMYGQTEATARMAYLPPELAEEHAGCVGIAIPGGSFRIDPLPDWPDADGTGVGELVYSGPNVMLGYAESPADLAMGRTIDELRTGDVARLTDAGLIEIVGRRGRFLKLFGLRIDLQQVEELLGRHGLASGCVGDDHALQIAVVGGEPDEVRRLVTQAYGLPSHAVQVRSVAELPRLDSGKVDYPALRGIFATPRPERAGATDLRALYAEVLDRPDATEDDTFVSLGGDSLSYVEMTVRLEQELGTIPPNWHVTAIRDLRRAATAAPARGWRSRIRRIETSVALRALAIILIIGDHIEAFYLPGAAHALIAVVGYNLARFSLSTPDLSTRLRHLAATTARIAAISAPVIALISVVYPHFTLTSFFNADYVFNLEVEIPGHAEGEYWFIFALFYLQLFVIGLIAIPWLHRLSVSYPFAFPMALMVLGLVARYQLLPGITLPLPAEVFWLLAAGWAAAQARNHWERGLVTAAIALVTWGFLDTHEADAETTILVLALIWLPSLPSTRLINRVAGVIAASTLATYLTHWQIFPVMRGRGLGEPVLVIVVCLVAGAVYFWAAEWAIARTSAWWRTLPREVWLARWRERLWRASRRPAAAAVKSAPVESEAPVGSNVSD